MKRRSIPHPEGVANRVVYVYLVAFVVFHALLPLAFVPWLFSWSGLLLIPALHFVFDWVGVGLCFHRTLTHGGLVLPKWLERTFVVFGLCNLMDSPARWVAIHRRHHQHTDEQPDPHSPLVTFWWGHMGWLIHENTELSSADFYHRYAPDILRDPFYLNIERYRLWAVIYFLHAGLIFLAGLATGWIWSGEYWGGLQLGLSWLLWGVVIRTIFSWHATFAVNSVTHIWGYRNYETRDTSTNHWLVALTDGRRRLAQQSPRSPRVGSSWTQVVGGRPDLLQHSRAQVPRPRQGSEGTSGAGRQGARNQVTPLRSGRGS